MEYLLTLPEELFLLTVNDKTGRKAFLKSRKFDILLSASLLMDLALHNRIDSDLEYIIPFNARPTGHPLLDKALEKIHRVKEKQKINWWLLKLAEEGPDYREILVNGLLQKGLIRMEREHVFLGFSSNRYPMLIHDQEIIEIKSRLKSIIFSDELPDFRDIVLVSIAWYGGLLHLILTENEIHNRQKRIEQLARMDLIGQAVTYSMKEVSRSILGYVMSGEIFGTRSPQEKLDELVEELKALMHIENDKDLPEWLRPGTEQYRKTLEYITETGTNEIVFNTKTGKYALKAGANEGKIL